VPTRSTLAVRRVYSAVAYAAFLAAALWGVMFLANLGPTSSVDSRRPGSLWLAVVVDLGLWLVFGLHHSVMARARGKQRLARVIPGPLERSTYVLSASLALGLLFWQWRALPTSVWRVDAQPWAAMLWAVYGAGWAVVFASTFMTDHGEFLGLRQAGWLTGRPRSAAALSRRWLYAWVRHPMMAGLLVAFWATPVMTVGHLLFAVLGSGYIAIGVHFEERDLRQTFGTTYDDYARKVGRLLPKPHPIA
jgi:protein-S-isoprenylcysteine O-methyltransferase Ste14